MSPLLCLECTAFCAPWFLRNSIRVVFLVDRSEEIEGGHVFRVFQSVVQDGVQYLRGLQLLTAWFSPVGLFVVFRPEAGGRRSSAFLSKRHPDYFRLVAIFPSFFTSSLNSPRVSFSVGRFNVF